MRYTSAEFIAFPVALTVIGVVVFLSWLVLRNRGEFAKRIPFVIVTLALLGLEITKQVLRIAEFGPYNRYHLPFHYCSYFIIWFGIASFTWGRVRQVGIIASFVTVFLFMIGFFLEPREIIGDASANMLSNYYAFHSFLFHFLVIQFFALIIAFDLFRPNHKLFAVALGLHIGVLALSLLMAHLFDANFASMLHGQGSLGLIQEAWGRVWLTILMFVVVMLADSLVYFGVGVPYYHVRQRLSNRSESVRPVQMSD